MFTFPTLRSTLFFMAVWGVFLAGAALVTSPSGATVLGGALLGAFAGFVESQALRALPVGLSNSTADFPARRSAFLATLPGKLLLGAQLLSVLAVIATAVFQRSTSAIVVIPAFGLARHVLVLFARMHSNRSRRANEA